MTDLTGRSTNTPQQWAKALTVREAQHALGPLESVDDVERWLKLIPLMQRTGRLRSKLVTTTIVNTARRWCTRGRGQLDPGIMASIEHRLAEIESKTSSGQRPVIPTKPAIANSTTPQSSTGHMAAPIKEKRVRQRRRLANRRQGQECRSGDDRRLDSRRQRTSDGRRGRWDRRAADRRTERERRAGRDRRHVA